MPITQRRIDELSSDTIIKLGGDTPLKRGNDGGWLIDPVWDDDSVPYVAWTTNPTRTESHPDSLLHNWMINDISKAYVTESGRLAVTPAGGDGGSVTPSLLFLGQDTGFDYDIDHDDVYYVKNGVALLGFGENVRLTDDGALLWSSTSAVFGTADLALRRIGGGLVVRGGSAVDAMPAPVFQGYLSGAGSPTVDDIQLSSLAAWRDTDTGNISFWFNYNSNVSSLASVHSLFTADTDGIVPASGGGSLKALYADGVWRIPGAPPPLSDDNTVVVTGSGNAATDLANWDTAVADLVSMGHGNLVINGHVRWPAGTVRAIPVGIQFYGAYPGCILDGQGSTSRLDVGPSAGGVTHNSGMTTILGGIERFRSSFTATNGLAVGNYVIVTSDDLIGTGESFPQLTYWYPGEVRRVVAVSGGASNAITLGGAITALVSSNTSEVDVTGYIVNSDDIGSYVNVRGGTISAKYFWKITDINTAGSLNRWVFGTPVGSVGNTITGAMGRQAILDAPVADNMMINARLKVLTMVTSYVHDLTFKHMQVSTYRLADSRIERCYFDECSVDSLTTAFACYFSHNVLFINNVVNNGQYPNTQNGIAIGESSNVMVANNVISGSGLMFTTIRGETDGPSAWGGARGVSVKNNIVYSHPIAADLDSGPALETHPESYDTWFDGNDVHLTGGEINGLIRTAYSCIRVRSRRVKVTNNKFFGPTANAAGEAATSAGVEVFDAGETLIKGNIYSNVGTGIHIFSVEGRLYGGYHIEDEHFERVSHAAIRVTAISEDRTVLIANCICKEHGGFASTGLYNAWIQCDKEEIPVHIQNCYLPKSSNTYSVYANDPLETGIPASVVLGNHCYGYGNNNDGTGGSGIATKANFRDGKLAWDSY